MSQNKSCATVLIAGKANAGKSTLLNRLLGRKVSITSRRPQTTISRILGVKNIESESLKIFFIDTPGLYPGIQEPVKASKLVYSLLSEVDLVLIVADITKWGEHDQNILTQIKSYNLPTILALNKTDLLEDSKKIDFLPEGISGVISSRDIFPISSTKGINLLDLEKKIISHVPRREYTYSDKQSLLKNNILTVSEILREKFMRILQRELAYTIRIQILSLTENLENITIFAVVWARKPSQKYILIGKDGSLLKVVCTRARKSIEALFKKKAYIKVRVKTEKEK